MKTITIIFIFSLFTSVVCAEDSNDLYRKDYDRFWVIWAKEKKNFISCESANKSKKFLVNTLATSGNSEVSEANYKVIEETILKNPKCVLDAVLVLSDNEQQRVTNVYIVRPLFHNVNEIESSLKMVWSEKKYRKIKVEFLRLKKEIYKK